MNWLWKLWLGAGLLVAIVIAVTVTNSDVRLASFFTIAAMSVGAGSLGMQHHRAGPRSPWQLAAAGMASYVLGDLVYRWLEFTTETEFPAFPSIADVFYILLYPLLGAGIFAAASQRGRGPRHGRALTSAVVAGAVVSRWMLENWVFDLVAGGFLEANALVVALAYPALSVALLMVACYALIASTGNRARLLALSGVTMFIGDALYNNALNNGNFQVGGAEDLFWLLTFVLIGASAACPASTQRPTEADWHTEALPAARSLVDF